MFATVDEQLAASLEASEEVRRAFVTASPANRHEFLAGFLVALLALDAPGKTVHVAGRGTGQ